MPKYSSFGLDKQHCEHHSIMHSSQSEFTETQRTFRNVLPTFVLDRTGKCQERRGDSFPSILDALARGKLG